MQEFLEVEAVLPHLLVIFSFFLNKCQSSLVFESLLFNSISIHMTLVPHIVFRNSVSFHFLLHIFLHAKQVYC